MTEAALRRMAACVGLPLVAGHGGLQSRYVLQGEGPARRIGTVGRCEVEDGRLVVTGVLDPESAAARQVERDVHAGRVCALSVGGRVTSAHWARDDGTGEMVRHIDDVRLDHIALCSRDAAVNPDTSLELVARCATEAPGAARVRAEVGEDELIMRLRGLLERAWRSLREPESAPDTERLREMLDQIASEVEALRAQVRELGEMRKASSALVVAGASQCLQGQESRRGDLWHGVL